MKEKDFLETDLSFPIISIIGNEFIVFQNPRDYFVCVRDYIPQLNKLKEYIIDANGTRFIRTEISFIKYINAFKGFSLKAAGFGVAYVNKQIEKIKDLSIVELKEIGHNILVSNKNHYIDADIRVKKWKEEFKLMDDKEEILRYIFFFADTNRFYHPDMKDNNWRNRKGFVKY